MFFEPVKKVVLDFDEPMGRRILALSDIDRFLVQIDRAPVQPKYLRLRSQSRKQRKRQARDNLFRGAFKESPRFCYRQNARLAYINASNIYLGNWIF